MEKFITIGQLDRAAHWERTIYLQAMEEEGEEGLVELTDFMRGSECITSWAIHKLLPTKDGEAFIAVINLPKDILYKLAELEK